MKSILILSASNNKNLELAKKFELYFSQNEIKSEVIDLVSLELPLYSSLSEEKGVTNEVLELTKKVKSAKSIIFVTPEYNGGLPPVLTNAIAWVSRSGDKDWRSAFNNKPAAIASFSGSGGVQALTSLRTQLSYIGMNVIGRQVIGTFKQDVNVDDLNAVAAQLIK